MRNPLGFVLLLVALAGFWWLRQGPNTASVPAPVSVPVTSPHVASSAAPPAEPVTTTSVVTRDTRTPTTARHGNTALPDFLPAEARQTIALIQRGGPYPHRQDGSVFGNRERQLPAQPRGWYHEYTVNTPGLHHRGARRIVTGGNPPSEWYYSDDHYASFRRFDGNGVHP